MDFDLDLDVVGALAGMNKVCQVSHRKELVLLKTVDVQDEEPRFRLKNTFCDRNWLAINVGVGERP